MNNDLISREALKEALNTWDKFGYTAKSELIRLTSDNEKLYRPYIHYEDVINCIDNAPTVERPQGEWKVYGKQGGIPITDMCSNCRYEMKWYKNKYKFCPNCGADMRGDKNG